MKISCTICRELFLSAHVVLVTNCGHLYHKDCIMQWTSKQHSCPQCRAKLAFQPIRLFFNIEDNVENSFEEGLLETKYSELNEKYAELSITKNTICKGLEAAKAEVQLLTEKLEMEKTNNIFNRQAIKALGDELVKSKKYYKELKQLKIENQKVCEELELLKSIDAMLKGSERSVTETIENMPCTPQSYRQLLTFVEVMKQKSVQKSERYKIILDFYKQMRDELTILKRENESLTKRLQDYTKPKLPPPDLTECINLSPPPDLPLTECINLCSPGISDVPIKITDKSQIRKQSTETLRPSKIIPSKRFLSGQSSSATSSSFSFDGMGGSKRISLAKPTPPEELFRMRVNKHLNIKPKIMKPIERKTNKPIYIPDIPDIMDISSPECDLIELD